MTSITHIQIHIMTYITHIGTYHDIYYTYRDNTLLSHQCIWYNMRHPIGYYKMDDHQPSHIALEQIIIMEQIKGIFKDRSCSLLSTYIQQCTVYAGQLVNMLGYLLAQLSACSQGLCGHLHVQDLVSTTPSLQHRLRGHSVSI